MSHLPRPKSTTPKQPAQPLAWAARQRVAAVVPMLVLLWLAVAWALQAR